MTDENNRSILVISAVPASSENLASSSTAKGSLSFREQVPIRKMREYVKNFGSDIGEIFSEIGEVEGEYFVDSIEISALMAADGKLWLLGSELGTKAEGQIKLLLKRKQK